MSTKQTEALKLALEALEFIPESGSILGSQAETKRLQAITAIREALAEQPAQPCGYPYCGCNSKAWCKLERMAENARELGLDYEPIVEQVEDFVGMGHKAWDMVDPKELAKGFHEALAEPPCKTGSQCTNKCQQCEQPAPVAEPHKQQKPAARQYQGRDGVWRDFISEKHYKDTLEDGSWPIRDLYASPPPNTNAGKPWVGLTEKEKLALVEYADEAGLDDMKFIEDIEAKLKEKNA